MSLFNCLYCGAELTRKPGPGRPPKFCPDKDCKRLYAKEHGPNVAAEPAAPGTTCDSCGQTKADVIDVDGIAICKDCAHSA